MRMTVGNMTDQAGARDCPALLTLDLASLGQLVRSGTCDAVAMHFEAMGIAQAESGQECEVETQLTPDGGAL